MPDVVTVREAVQRAKADGLPITEYTLRHWLNSGAIPTRRIGQKVLLFYPNLVKHLKCEDGADNTPSTVSAGGSIRRVDM